MWTNDDFFINWTIGNTIKWNFIESWKCSLKKNTFRNVVCNTVAILLSPACVLTHWGRVMHIYVGNVTIIDSDNVLSPDRRQAII